MTALMIAVRGGKVACLKLLIRKGARINLSRNRVRGRQHVQLEGDQTSANTVCSFMQNRGTTALHIAARGGLDECVSILIDAGASLDIQSVRMDHCVLSAADREA